eukprot:COSAG01_NODE_4272_length_5193_cov_7.742638_3_plen_597_part_00
MLCATALLALAPPRIAEGGGGSGDGGGSEGCAGVAPVPGAEDCPAEEWSWTKHGNKNCFNDRPYRPNTDPQHGGWYHGAANVLGVGKPCATNATASQCRQVCSRTQGCTGAVYGRFSPNSADPKARQCFCVNKVVMSYCYNENNFDVYTRAPAGVTWSDHPDLDCTDQPSTNGAYHGYHGANDMDSSHYYDNFGAEQCQARCDGWPGCTGMLIAGVKNGGSRGRCYIKTNIDLSQCIPNDDVRMYTRDRSCEGRCLAGYVAHGNRTFTCTANRSWVGGDLRCLRRRCSAGPGGAPAVCINSTAGHVAGCETKAQKCVCQWPWYGERCEQRIDSSSPVWCGGSCQHGGTCTGHLKAGKFGELETDWDIGCQCHSQWSGPECKIPHPCEFKDEARAACKHGGVCTTSTVAESGFTCDCNATGYTGLKCTQGGPHDNKDERDSWAVEVSVGVTGAGVAVLILCLYICKYKRGGDASRGRQGRSVLRQSILGPSKMPDQLLAANDVSTRWMGSRMASWAGTGPGGTPDSDDQSGNVSVAPSHASSLERHSGLTAVPPVLSEQRRKLKRGGGRALPVMFGDDKVRSDIIARCAIWATRFDF